MSKTTLLFLDGFLFTFHTALVLFNVFGWIPKRTRRANLVCLTLTFVSWFVMGIWHGIGYCVVTDWHWQVRRALGFHDPEGSYIELLIRVLTGWHVAPDLVQNISGAVFILSVIASLIVNVRAYCQVRVRNRDHA